MRSKKEENIQHICYILAQVARAIKVFRTILGSCYDMSNKVLENKLSTFKQHNTLILNKLTGLYKLTILRLTQLVLESYKWILRSNLTISTGTATSPCRNFHRRDCPKTKFSKVSRCGVKLISTRIRIVASRQISHFSLTSWCCITQVQIWQHTD